jgi:hypothetical protein
MAEQLAKSGGVGQIYDQHGNLYETVVKEYLLAWAALLETGEGALALTNTVEVQSLSGRTIGLIVLPAHPLRVAWHTAYDNLVLEDQWMLESTSLPGGLTLPRLRWARKQETDPRTAAHLAVAFDTFESRVVMQSSDESRMDRPFFAFGLMFFERRYASAPAPVWLSAVVCSTDGERHPADRIHTDRLVRMEQAILGCVARDRDSLCGIPVLRTEISPEKAQSLRELHRLCDWVITIDRNAGVEYFDSPHDNREIYDAYVIDCVPEREDLRCFQLITSTSNLDEIRNLLDEALDLMGLSRSRRNTVFLSEHLKALSGRLAIQLTGQKAPAAELIALAICHAMPTSRQR